MRWNILIYGCSQKGKKWKMVELYLNFLCKVTFVMSAYIQTRIILRKRNFFSCNIQRNIPFSHLDRYLISNQVLIKSFGKFGYMAI